MTIMKEGIGHILDVTRIGEKMKESLKRGILNEKKSLSYKYKTHLIFRMQKK